MEQAKNLLLHWWLGLSFATLFFYPLISALSAQPFYMHWDHRNTLEFVVAMLAIGTVLGSVLFVAERNVKSARVKTLITLVVASVPFFTSLTYVTAYQLGIGGWLRTLNPGMTPAVLYIVLVLIAAMIGYFGWRYHEIARRAILAAALVMSPFIVFASVAVVRAGYLEPTLTSHAETEIRADSGRPIRNSVFILLYDEMDYGFLYSDGQVREEFPNIRAFASKADNYHRAFSPGSHTLVAIPGLLVGRKVNVDAGRSLSLYEVSDEGAIAPLDVAGAGLFSSARARGFTTVLYGWMFPYCEILKRKIDECQAVSIYNYATVNDSFSIINPIFTNIVLGPHQVPLLGYLKTLIYSKFHHQTASRIYDLAVASLKVERPVFELVHFNLPHSPFVYDGVRYNPARDPWLQNEENYVKQLKYIDQLVGRFLAEMEKQARLENSDVIIMSDHGYRALAHQDGAYHVPLLIKRAGQQVRRDHDQLVQTELILRGFVREVEKLDEAHSS